MDAFLLLNVGSWRFKCAFDLQIDICKPLMNYLRENKSRINICSEITPKFCANSSEGRC